MRREGPPRASSSAPAGGSEAAKPRAWGEHAGAQALAAREAPAQPLRADAGAGLLDVSGLNSYYGDSHILFDVSLRVERNEVVALLGRNGAGKSTTLKSLMGVVTPRTGSVKLDGVEIAGRKSHQIAQAGMQLVHEDRRIFGTLDVEENLILAGLTAKERWPLDRIYEMFPRLKERRGSRGTDLSGGEQQMLAIGRALMSKPTIFLLDEPSLGLAPVIVERIGEILHEIQKSEGLSIILAEQNAAWAMSIAQTAVILELGSCTMVGVASELMEHPQVRKAYLGL